MADVARFPVMKTMVSVIKNAGGWCVALGIIGIVFGIVLALGLGDESGLSGAPLFVWVSVIGLGIFFVIGGIFMMFVSEAGGVLLAIEDNGYQLLNLQKINHQAQLRESGDSDS